MLIQSEKQIARDLVNVSLKILRTLAAMARLQLVLEMRKYAMFR